MAYIFNHPRDVADTKDTCIARLAKGERMRGCLRAAEYLHGRHEPNYPVPAIDYYNSHNPDHVAIGNCMEWAIPVEIQLRFRVQS